MRGASDGDPVEDGIDAALTRRLIAEDIDAVAHRGEAASGAKGGLPLAVSRAGERPSRIA